MTSIDQSHSSMAEPAPQGEFRRIPVGELQFPLELFAPDTSPGAATVPEQFVPLTVYPSGGSFIVIDGCKRLRRARQSGSLLCNCMVLSPVPDERTAALLRIALNRTRQLDFTEKYLFVAWLKKHCDDAFYRETCLQLPLDERERFEFDRLASCDNDVVTAVRDGVLDSANAGSAGYLEVAERIPIFLLFRRHSFSRQMQRELLDWLPELAFREKCSVAELIAAPWLLEIEQNVKLNGPQKIELVRSALFSRRFPTLAKAKRIWEEHAAKLNPDRSHVQFKPSEAFEKNRLEIKISVTSGESAQAIFSKLSQIPIEAWDRLIYPAMVQHDARE